MKRSSWLAVAAFLAIVIAGVVFVPAEKGAEPAPEPDAGRPPIPSGLSAPDRARWLRDRGQHLLAAEELEKGLAQAATREESRQLLSAMAYEAAREIQGNVPYLRALLALASREKMPEEVRRVGESLLEADPGSEQTRVALGYERRGDRWISPEELEVERAALERRREEEAFARMTERERRLLAWKKTCETEFRAETVSLDGHPDAPWFVQVETGGADDAGLRAAEILKGLNALYAEFCRLFREHVDVDSLVRSSALPVYVFSHADRLHAFALGERGAGCSDRLRRAALLSGPDCGTLAPVFRAAVGLLIEEIQRRHGRHDRLRDGLDAWWINSGLAGYFEAATCDRDGTVAFGGLPPRLAAAAATAQAGERRRSLMELTDLPATEAWRLRRDPELLLALDAECWAAVAFFLTAADEQHRRGFLDLCAKEWSAGGTGRLAQLALEDMEDLDDRWRQWAKALQ